MGLHWAMTHSNQRQSHVDFRLANVCRFRFIRHILDLASLRYPASIRLKAAPCTTLLFIFDGSGMAIAAPMGRLEGRSRGSKVVRGRIKSG